jgi:hypothetical protein
MMFLFRHRMRRIIIGDNPPTRRRWFWRRRRLVDLSPWQRLLVLSVRK